MADPSEETPLDDSGEETVVVTEEDGETTVDDSEVNVEVNPVVIVEDSGEEDAGASDAEVDRAVETERRFNDIESQLGALVGAVSELSAQVSNAQFSADIANESVQVVAEEAAELEEVVAETVAEDLGEDLDNDPDTPPDSARAHWWFRKRKDWKTS